LLAIAFSIEQQTRSPILEAVIDIARSLARLLIVRSRE
jgi:hypothetical protein